MHTKISTIVRTIIIVISSLMLIWSVWNKITEGTFIGIIGFGAIIAACVFYKQFLRGLKFCWSKTALRITVIAVGGIIAVLACVFVYFTVNMALRMEVNVDNPKAVIVLGCQVNGEIPSNMLYARMNKAMDIAEENQGILIVVCGGKGEGEDITEAEAMRRYFEEKGIPKDQIIFEDKSTSTEENIAFAAEMLKERGISDGIVIVTNEFHQYRAYVFAKKNGLETGAHSAKTYLPNLLNYWIREWAGLLHQFVFSSR